MKKILKKVLAVAISVCLSILYLQSFSITAFADESAIDDYAIDGFEYFRFNEIDYQMNSNGSFTFQIRYSVRSDSFTANSNTIAVQTVANIYDSYLNSTYTDSSKTFTVTLCKSTGGAVGSYTGYANSIYGGKSFTVTPGAKYYLVITCPGSLPVNCWISGYGKVSSVTVN